MKYSILLFGFLLSASSLHAAALVWNDAASGNTWNTTDFTWTTAATAFTPGDSVTFSGSGETITVDAPGVAPASTTVSAGVYTFGGGPISGTLTKSGTTVLTVNAANNFSGVTISGGPGTSTHTGSLSTTAVTDGNYTAFGSGTISLTNTVAASMIYFRATGTLQNPMTVTSSNIATWLVGSGGMTTTLAGLISGGNTSDLVFDTNAGSGTPGGFKLTNAGNTFTQRVNINRGTLEATSDGALGNPGNDLYLNVGSGNANTGFQFGADNITLNSGRAVTIATTTVIDTKTFTGSRIDGTVAAAANSIYKYGSGDLTFNNTVTGTGVLQFMAGTLKIGTGGTAGTLSSMPVSFRSAGSTLVFNRSDALAVPGVLSCTTAGFGGLVQAGAGTTTLSGASTYTGSITTNAGALDVTGTMGTLSSLTVAGGEYKFGSAVTKIGTQSVGSVTHSSGTLSLDISGGSTDVLNVSGAYTHTGGNIVVNMLSAPATGVDYPLVNYGTLTGTPTVTVTGLSGTRITAVPNLGTGTNSAISVQFVGFTGNLTWTGATSGEWDLSTHNWANDELFFQQDAVYFDDTAEDFNPTLGIAVQPSTVFFDNSEETYTLSGSGSIAGGGVINKAGTGTVILATDNTNTGITTIYSGTLQLGAGGTTGSLGASEVVNGGTLAFDRTGTFEFANTVSGAGSISKLGTGTLVVTGNLTQSGDITISAGSLQLGNGGATGAVTAAKIVNNSILAINRTGTIGTTITGTGSVVKTGTTAVVLNGSNDYAGGTVIVGGSLGTPNATSLGSGSVIFGAPATLAAANNSEFEIPNDIVLPAAAGNYVIAKSTASTSTGTAVTMSGTISGGGASSVLYLHSALIDDNTSLIVLSGDNTFTGTVRVNRGTLGVTGPTSLGAATNPLILDTYANRTSGTVRFLGSFTLPNPIQFLYREHTFAVNDSNAVTLSGVVSGNSGYIFEKIGTGKLTLSNAANSYPRATSIKEGTLSITGGLTATTNVVTVETAGTLTGNGTINRPVAVNGKLAPGEGVGVLTVPSTVTFAPGSTCDLQIADWTGAAGSGYDQLVATSLAVTATSGSKFTVHVDASSLVNFTEGSKTFVIATGVPTGLTTDNWTVTTTGFSGTGVWSLQANGNTLELVYGPAAGGFDSWITGFPSLPVDQRGLTNDYDNDGMSNLLEYVLSGNPTMSDSGTIRSDSALSGGNLVFTYTRLDTSKADTTQIVQHGSSLTGWNDVPITATGGGMVEITDGTPTDTVKVTIPMGGNTKLFARLKVTKP